MSERQRPPADQRFRASFLTFLNTISLPSPPPLTFLRALRRLPVASDSFTINGVPLSCSGYDGSCSVLPDSVADATAFTDRFRERNFGSLDGLPLSTYAYVWPAPIL